MSPSWAHSNLALCIRAIVPVSLTSTSKFDSASAAASFYGPVAKVKTATRLLSVIPLEGATAKVIGGTTVDYLQANGIFIHNVFNTAADGCNVMFAVEKGVITMLCGSVICYVISGYISIYSVQICSYRLLSVFYIFVYTAIYQSC
jgi:hypothetical protein